ncbi:MAG: 30S ribosomal protein S8 [Candidatus ainarchaeum sp.]|nr:30S ribosomal protein S8 [Candidatus ainarchaeum sp.]
MDHLADALNTIKTHEMVGQEVCTVRATKLIGEVLRVLKEHQYLTEYKLVENGRGGLYEVKLDGRINECGVIKPRMPVRKTDWARKEQQFIPGFGVGLLIVSTPNGIMTNADAEKGRVGGRLLAYVY